MRRWVLCLAVWASSVAVVAPAHVDAAGGQWLPRASLATARQEVGAARIGNTVYVVGGLAGPPLAGLASVEAYDVTVDDWTTVAPLPAPRDHMGVAALDGLLYVVGGFAGDFAARGEVFVYDPGADEWTAGPPLPVPRGGLWLVAYAGKLYAFGGVGLDDQATRSTFVLDPVAGEWTPGADMPTAREHLNAVVVEPFIYVIGGRGSGGSTGANERYDPATDTWTAMAAMPTARSAAAAAALGGRIWVAGGEVPQLFAVNEVYDVASDRWCRDTPMAVPRHGIAAVALDDRILTPAGGIVQGLQATAAADVFVPGDEPRFATAPACPPAPGACRGPLAPRRSTLALSDPVGTKRDRLAWLWARGAATTSGELGNPLAGDGVVLCLYDGGALRSAWRVFGDAPACGLAPADVASRWRANRRGFTYANRAGTPDGIHRVTLRSGLDGKAVVAVNGKGGELVLPGIAGLASPVVVQLHATTGACFTATFGAPFALRQNGTRFSDRSD